jgi:hypothetical protein
MVSTTPVITIRAAKLARGSAGRRVLGPLTG